MSKKLHSFHLFFSFLIFILLFCSFSTFCYSNNQNQLFINKISSVRGIGYDVSISGDFAYVTSNDGLDIINIQDPFKPKKITCLEISNGAFGVFIIDNLAFIAAGGEGLVIANISDSENPTILGQNSGHGIANKGYATEDYAFMTCYEDGLKIFDIDNHANPVKIGDYFYSGRVDDVVVIDNIAFLANPSLGVEVINVTLPSSPQRIRTIATPSGATSLSFNEDLLFVGCYTSRVWVIDISSPKNPSILGSHTDSDDGEAQGVAGNSTHLYVADNYGVEFLNISNLPDVTEVAELRQGISGAHDIDFIDNFLFIAGGSLTTGFIIFEISSNQKSSSIGIYLGVPVAVIVLSLSSWLFYRFKLKKKKN